MTRQAGGRVAWPARVVLLVATLALAVLCALVPVSHGAAASPSPPARTSRTPRALGKVSWSPHLRAGPSRTPCIYATLGPLLQQAQKATGITYPCIEVFVTGSDTWAQWVHPWVTQAQYGFLKWRAANPTGRTIVITTNLAPNDVVRGPGWRAEGAAGAFDRYARQLAANLVKAGLGSSVIRLGPEMNGPWEVDWIGKTAIEQRYWAEYFARIVRAMRAVPGAHFLFDWNVNAGYENIPLARFYPGDDVVDIVGIDAYDEAPIPLPPVGSPNRWSVLTSEPLGLLDIYAFAQQHHKPVSIPEWGTLSSHGDDAAYVAGIGAFVATHDVAYQCWFDAGDNQIYQLGAQAPRSLEAYAEWFSSPAAGTT